MAASKARDARPHSGRALAWSLPPSWFDLIRIAGRQFPPHIRADGDAPCPAEVARQSGSLASQPQVTSPPVSVGFRALRPAPSMGSKDPPADLPGIDRSRRSGSVFAGCQAHLPSATV
jgi:hypothetical protein